MIINPKPIAAADIPKIMRNVYLLFYALILNSFAYNVEKALN
jgi:hypothetical protein